MTVKQVIYSLSDGEISDIYTGSSVSIDYDPNNHGKFITAQNVEPIRHYVDLENMEVLERQRMDYPATWEQIKNKRNSLEVSPITLDSGLAFDYDQQAKLRFETALSQFDNLPTLIDGQLAWKLADNTFELHTKAELQAVYDELQQKTAIRASLLFAQAESIAATSPTVGEVEALATWGL